MRTMRHIAGLALLLSLAATPAYAKNAGDVLGEIFFRILIDGAANSIAGPPPPSPPPEPEAIIQPDPSQRLKGQDVSYLTPAGQSRFHTRDFARSFITVIGGAATDSTRLVVQDEVPDPALTVSDDLVAALARHYDARARGAAPAGTTSAPPAQGSPVMEGFLVQVTTTYWEMKAVSINPIHIGYGMHHYGVYYKARFRLLDRRDGSILAEGHCNESPDTWGAPLYDEALADGGKKLKEMSVAIAHQCALTLENDYLGITVPEA